MTISVLSSHPLPLPMEILSHIVHCSTPEAKAVLAKVCRFFREFVNDDRFWKSDLKREFPLREIKPLISLQVQFGNFRKEKALILMGNFSNQGVWSNPVHHEIDRVKYYPHLDQSQSIPENWKQKLPDTTHDVRPGEVLIVEGNTIGLYTFDEDKQLTIPNVGHLDAVTWLAGGELICGIHYNCLIIWDRKGTLLKIHEYPYPIGKLQVKAPYALTFQDVQLDWPHLTVAPKLIR